jgi:prepilin-type N-terminal cleavage/methylation domain-containing protein
MKSEFKTKLIQHMLNKKNGEKGFTLIELLVVIIIIGILAAIALPSFLSQSNKAKQSEAKTYVGTLNKGQQAYYTEKGQFGANLDLLAVGVKADTANYSYTSLANTSTTTSSNNSLSKGLAKAVALRSYAGSVQLITVSTTSDVTSVATLCETNSAGVLTNILDLGAAATTVLISTTTTGPTCVAAVGAEVGK